MANVKWSSFTNVGDCQIGDIVVGLRSGGNVQFTFPSDGIKDAAGHFLIGWSSVAGATNYVEITNASTGNPALITTLGGDSDPGLKLSTKGNGVITLQPGGTGNIVTTAQLILNTSSPSTALQAASKGYVDSLIPALPLSLANGGTGASLVASNGGIFYSTGSAGAILSGTATANQVLLSGSSAAPSWSTAVYPATTTINQLLYSPSANNISGLSTANNGVLVTSITGVPSILSGSGVTGNMLSSNSGAAPSWSTAVYANTYAINTILYASSANTIMGLATANSASLVTNSTGVPSWSSSMTNGQLIIGSTGATPTAATLTAGTGISISNGSGSISISTTGAVVTPAALTASNDTNVTLTLGGSPTTALVNAASITAGWTGQLSLARGGTNANLTASNGGIVYSGASALAILAGTATANQILMSGSNTTPAWSTAAYPATAGTSGTLMQSNGTNWVNTTATYPGVATSTGTILRADGTNWVHSTATFADTYTASNLLYSNGTNTVTGLATANSAVLVTNSSGVPAWSGTMTNGQLIIGSTTATPTAATLTAGTGISITNGAGSITIAASSGGMTWSTVTGTTQAASVNNGYVTNNAGAVTVTLPTTFAVGDVVIIKGLGAGGWVLAAGTATTIRLGSSVTSSAGSLTSANQYDTVKVTGLVANTTWSVDYVLSSGLTVA